HFHSQGRSMRGGFTLIEMVLSLAIIAILLLGMQSAILLAARATPDSSNSPLSSAIVAGRAVDRLSADLTFANSVTSAGTTSITFTVPDRTGDNSPETITYSWSGVSGDPLLRKINSGTASTVATNVTEFQLAYDKRSQQASTTYTESGETLLANNDGIGLLN